MNDRITLTRNSHRESISKRNTKTPSDSDLIVKYVDKLNEIIEENNILNLKIKEKDQLIKNYNKYRKKHIKNFNCCVCEISKMEIEDYLNQLYISKKKNKKLKIAENNHTELNNKKFNFNNLYITSENRLTCEKSLNKLDFNQLLTIENLKFEFKGISIK